MAIDKTFKLILGQKLETFSETSFSADKSFSGRFTDVVIYRGALDEDSIESFSKCRLPNGRNVVVVDWNVNAFDGNEIDVEDVSSDVLCATDRTGQMAIFNHGASHSQVHLVLLL